MITFMKGKGKHLSVTAAACALALAGAVALSFFSGTFLVDDAFISFRYSHHLASGEGLVFNPGDRLEGYTNFLWVLILAAAEAHGLPIPGTATVLGFLFGVAGLWATWLLARAVLQGSGPFWPLIPVLLTATSRSYWLWAVSGMENALYGTLITAGAASLAGSAPGMRLRLSLGSGIMALAVMARPEAPLVFFLVLAVMATPPRPPVGARDLARSLAVFAVPVVLYGAWKLWYFGELLPNTFYAKNVGAAKLAQPGLRYITAFLADYGFGAGLLLPVLAPFLASPGKRRRAAVPLSVLAGYLAYLWAVGGDIYYHYRFLTPVLPFLFTGMTAAAFGMTRRLLRVGPGKAAALAACLLLAFGAAADLSTEKRYRDVRVKDRSLNDFRERVSAWLSTDFSPNQTIATISVGIIPFRTGLRTVDLAGLTHREIGRSRVDAGSRAPLAHEKTSAEAVLREGPDLIEFRRLRSPHLTSAAGSRVETPDFAEFYRPFFQAPPRYPAWRDLALREDFHRSYRLVIYPLGDGLGVATFRRFPDGSIPLAEAWANYGWALQGEGFGHEGTDYLLRALLEAPGSSVIRRRLESLAADPPPGVDASHIRMALTGVPP